MKSWKDYCVLRENTSNKSEDDFKDFKEMWDFLFWDISKPFENRYIFGGRGSVDALRVSLIDPIWRQAEDVVKYGMEIYRHDKEFTLQGDMNKFSSNYGSKISEGTELNEAIASGAEIPITLDVLTIKTGKLSRISELIGCLLEEEIRGEDGTLAETSGYTFKKFIKTLEDSRNVSYKINSSQLPFIIKLIECVEKLKKDHAADLKDCLNNRIIRMGAYDDKEGFIHFIYRFEVSNKLSDDEKERLKEAANDIAVITNYLRDYYGDYRKY